MMKVLMLQCMEDGDNLVWDKTMCLMCIAKGLQQFIGETDTPKLFYLVQPFPLLSDIKCDICEMEFSNKINFWNHMKKIYWIDRYSQTLFFGSTPFHCTASRH